MVAEAVNFLFEVAQWLIIAGVVLSLIGQATHAAWLRNPLVQFVLAASDALCAPFRALLESLGLPTRPLDFSPLIALLVLQFLQRWLVSLLLSS